MFMMDFRRIASNGFEWLLRVDQAAEPVPRAAVAISTSWTGTG